MNPIRAILHRNLLHFVRNRSRLIGSIVMAFFSVGIFSFMMGPFLEGMAQSMNYLISGIIIMTVFQTSINNSSDILTDISSGYMKEVMVAPISRLEIAVGNILSGAVIATLQGILITLATFLIGLRVSFGQFLLMLVLMFGSALVFSALGLYLATLSRNSTGFQTVSSMIMMPLTLLSGAYIPTTILPKFLAPIVYINPLTYVTAFFRSAVLGGRHFSLSQQIQEGLAFEWGSLVITPQISVLLTTVIGLGLLYLCIRKFNEADFSTVQVARLRR